MSDLTLDELERMKRPQLQAQCKKHGIKATGTNAALVEALRPFAQQPTVDSHQESPAQPSTCALTSSQVQDMIQAAVTPYQQHLQSLQEDLVKAADRISALESSHANLSQPKSTCDSHTQTEQQQQQQGTMEPEDARMEADEVADLLCPLPAASGSQPHSPSVAGDTSALSDVATVGFSSPARPLSPARRQHQSSDFSFLDEAGKTPQVPLSPPKPASHSHDMPLNQLPVPFPINPFLYSASKQQQQQQLPAADPLAGSSPLMNTGDSLVGPARSAKGPRSPSRRLNRSPRSKGYARRPHGAENAAAVRFGDVHEAVDLVGPDSQWSSWL